MDSAAGKAQDIKFLEEKLNSTKLPQDLYNKILVYVERLSRLTTSQTYSQEFDAVSRYLDWVVSLPWETRSKDILSLENAQKVLDKNHFGLENIKQRILDYIAVLTLRLQKVKKLKLPPYSFWASSVQAKLPLLIQLPKHLAGNLAASPWAEWATLFN